MRIPVLIYNVGFAALILVLEKAIVLAQLQPRDVRKFFRVFSKYDRKRDGFLELSNFFESIEDERTIFSDTLLDLLEILHDGRINFGAWLYMICTYCLFEPQEILKFCFYVFDQDKIGYFDTEELKLLMNILHRVKPGNTVQGNIKIAWQNLRFSDDDRVQHFVLGNGWWLKKGYQLQDARDALKRKQERKERRAHKKEEKLAEKKLRRKMGILRFYCCPCIRFLYAEPKPPPDPAAEEERQRKIREMLAEKRRLELLIKNPETFEHKMYVKKKEEFAEEKKNAGGSVGFLEAKLDKVDKARYARELNRAERKQKRTDFIAEVYTK